jgi:AcrR family transcriptional regulator
LRVEPSSATRVNSRTAGRPAGLRQGATRSSGQPQSVAIQPTGRSLRRDALHNYQRILAAAREVIGETGADACMEDIAARAGVGVGTVYRRFASKDALIDELLRLAMEQLTSDADEALNRTDGYGLHELLRAFGRSFAEHAGYANLLLERQPDGSAAQKLRAATIELTARAVAAGTVSSGITINDVVALTAAIRGLVHSAGDISPDAWQRFLDIHLAGMQAAAWGAPKRDR